MRIGIDLDDVVFEFASELLKIYKEKYGRKVNYEDMNTYQFSDLLNLSRKEFGDFIMREFDKIRLENLELCNSAYDSIEELSKENEIYFITSRVKKEGTLGSLNKHFNNIDFGLRFSSNPYFGNKGKTKGDICSELGIDYMIEDSKEHAEICASSGIKTFLLGKPWNRDSRNYDNIIRVNSWNEVLNKIKGDSDE